mgnify:CR=1 FL=1|tara:strand:- start:916 stop:1176 length:261 start_codon:yes stop_codon:yes gene_type:complete
MYENKKKMKEGGAAARIKKSLTEAEKKAIIASKARKDSLLTPAQLKRVNMMNQRDSYALPKYKKGGFPDANFAAIAKRAKTAKKPK